MRDGYVLVTMRLPVRTPPLFPVLVTTRFRVPILVESRRETNLSRVRIAPVFPLTRVVVVVVGLATRARDFARDWSFPGAAIASDPVNNAPVTKLISMCFVFISLFIWFLKIRRRQRRRVSRFLIGKFLIRARQRSALATNLAATACECPLPRNFRRCDSLCEFSL